MQDLKYSFKVECGKFGGRRMSLRTREDTKCSKILEVSIVRFKVK